MERSPAVDRAQAEAELRARDRGDGIPWLIDWLAVLLADEDGRPATLLKKQGISSGDALDHADRLGTHHRPAPTTDALMGRGRELATLLRGDPTLTTDALFLAVVEAAETVDGGFGVLGASLQTLADRFGGAASPAPFEAICGSAASREPEQSDFRIDDPFDSAQLHRILDASINRAREAARVVDDFVRFGLDDRVLTDELKQIRHELAETLDLIPIRHRLAFRDTVHDVGTTLGTAREYDRTSPRETARVNFKRMQEALRSIEEYGKQFGGDFARRIEALRYRVYTVERGGLAGSPLRDRIAAARLYVLLTGSQCTSSLDWTIRESAAGGATVFQLREKGLADRDLLARAIAVRKWTRETQTLFIVNDRPDIARLVDADGVHLGQDDLPVAAARKIVGPEMIIGVSTHDAGQIRRAVLDGADYLGVGPVFPSTTKSFDTFPGLAFVREAGAMTSLPCFALGGITPANVGDVLAAGLTRVAVASAITTSVDPQMAARSFGLSSRQPA
jgi:thiamine-phosphate pyrophosphorylase